jgi:asparagine synthase (glutamine-hydrolysing)
MSALAGRWNFDDKPDADELCRKMLAAQEIYGPDHGASWDGGSVALGRRLYRRLPEDRHDLAPQASPDGRWHLVADVRLDNRDELTGALGLDPETAARLPDATFLLAAWQKWREECFAHLLGDYAFAIWDAEDRRLILARDALGGRPLHYHAGRNFFAFASMPKGLHALPDVPYAPDEVSVAELLALIPEQGPRSFFEGISRVETGHVVSVTREGVTARRHWDPPREMAPPKGDFAEGLRAHLDRAVAARLRGADGRIGSQLSGGLDSSAVTATAARLLAPSKGQVIAYTAVPRAGYDGPDPAGRFVDESVLAAETAALYSNVEHVLVRPKQGTPLDGLDKDFFLCERPLLNACNHRWINDINLAAQRDGLKVLLVGTMGNMSLSYGGLERLAELAGTGRWLKLLGETRSLVKSGQVRLRGALGAAFGPWMPERAWRAVNKLANGRATELGEYSALNPARGEALNIAGTAKDRNLDLSYRPRRGGIESRLWTLRRIDIANFYKGWLGGWGVDVRDPTTDRRLVEYCLSLPPEAFLAKGRTRALARTALADRLPARVLDERRTGLQAADWHEGLTEARDMIRLEIDRLAQVPAAAEALDLERMRDLVEDWPEDGWNSARTQARYRQALLRGCATGHFLRKASRSNA